MLFLRNENYTITSLITYAIYLHLMNRPYKWGTTALILYIKLLV